MSKGILAMGEDILGVEKDILAVDKSIPAVGKGILAVHTTADDGILGVDDVSSNCRTHRHLRTESQFAWPWAKKNGVFSIDLLKLFCHFLSTIRTVVVYHNNLKIVATVSRFGKVNA